MRELAYNIDFEIAAIAFAVMLYVEVCLSYPKDARKNVIFRWMCLHTIITEAVDIAAALTITYGDLVPVWVNLVLNSLYFIFGITLCFLLHYYIEYAVIPDDGRHVMIRFNLGLTIAINIALVLNMFTGWFFYFSPEGEYLHGPAYLGIHIVSCFLVACGSISLFINRRKLKKSQILCGILFIIIFLSAMFVQTFFCEDYLLVTPAASMIMVVAIFSLESPDFRQLRATLTELTETKRKLEESNEKYYHLAYTDSMTGLKNRLAYNTRIDQLEDAPFRANVIFVAIDLNNLKFINDNMGHNVGDEAIKKVAELMRASFKGGCQNYRIGGDEFAVIAYDMTDDEFHTCYYEFETALQAAGKQCSYPFYAASGYQKVGTLSLEEAMIAADNKMYQNKRLTKDAVSDQQ